MSEKDEIKINLLSRASPAKPLKRFYATLIDLIFVLTLTYLSFLGGYGIASNTSEFKDAEATVKYEANYYKDFIEETHLAYYDDSSEKIRYEDSFFTYINITRLLIYSNDNDLSGVGWYDEILLHETEIELPSSLTELFNENIKYFEDFPVSSFEASSYENDDIAYFYTNYVKNHNENDDILLIPNNDYKSYFVNCYTDAFRSKINTYFARSADESTFPYVIEKNICKKIFYASNYLNQDTEGDEYYEFIENGYLSLRKSAETLMINSKNYNANPYQNYQNNYKKEGNILILTLVLSFIFGFLVYMLTTKLIFKDEQTLGRKLLKLGQITYKGERVKVKDIIIRTFVDMIFYFPLTFIFLFLPPFNSNANAFLLNLFSIGNFGVNLLVIYIVIIILVFINFISMLLTHYKLSLVDMITVSFCKDMHHLDEFDYDEREEGAL